MKSFQLAGFFNRGGRVYTGVDLGTYRIKVVRIKVAAGRTKPEVEVLGRAAVPTPADGLANGLNRPEMAAALGQALEAAGVAADAGDLVAAIGGGRVITRNLMLPVMPEKEMVAAVGWEAERHLPLPADELIIRHVTLEEVEIEGVAQQHVLLVAVPRDLVLKYAALFRETGRELLAIDLPALALWRMYFGLDSEAAQAGVVAVLDIGAVHTELVVVREGRFRYARSLPHGGNALTEALARTLGVDFAVAQRIKEGEEPGEAVSALPEQTGRQAVATGAAGSELSLLAGLVELVREVRRSLDWYNAQNRGYPVERIILSGGGSRADGLVDYLAQNLGLPVEIALMRAGPAHSIAPLPLDPAFAVAVGLALREVV
jgi:type IV pilus assembly protein PilM